MKSKVLPLFSLLTGFCVLAYLLIINPFIDRIDAVYSTDKLDSAMLEKIAFQDVTEEWGVGYDHSKNTNDQNTYLNTVHPSVLIYDFDTNGLMDIFYSGGRRNYLYLNFANGKFVESSAKFNLMGKNENLQQFSMGLMADFNNDGQDDIYLAAVPAHKFYLRNGASFKDSSEKLNNYRSFPDGANVLDFNQDGLMDIIVGNIIELYDTEDRHWYITRRYDQQTGGWNHLLLQDAAGNFSINEEIDFKTRSFTHAVGISDINNDGWPDIFFANDYSKDQMFENISGKKVREVTEKKIPTVWHGNSGMNAEFADYNQDGLIDLYVTYIHKPPFYRAFNILWQKKADNSGFEQVSYNENIGRCGFSWGAKFADFNLDGEQDLFVVNGRDRDKRITQPSEGKSFWYERTQLTSIPTILLQHMKKYERDPLKKYYNSGFERDCLFIQNKGKFFDVAKDLNLVDSQEGRGLALADFNNDGLMDIVVTNVSGTSKVYLNKSVRKNHWVGVELKNKYNSSLPIGALIRFRQSRGNVQVKEFYPGNGYRGQSDPRIIFTINENSHPESLEVKFPGNPVSVFYKDFKIDQYNEIKEVKE